MPNGLASWGWALVGLMGCCGGFGAFGCSWFINPHHRNATVLLSTESTAGVPSGASKGTGDP